MIVVCLIKKRLKENKKKTKINMAGDRKIDHIEDDLTRAPCVRYDSVFEIKDVSTVKIQINYDDGSPYQRANCYVYNSDFGAECFIIVKKKFEREMQALNADADDFWQKWNSCLDMTAFAAWESQTQGIVGAARTIARWQMEVTAFLRPMATSSGRDHLYAYLRHPNFKKPHDETVEKWNARTNALMDAGAEMEGVEPVLDPNGRKKIKFESYDSNWRSQFTLSNNYNAMTEGDMIQWFKDKKLDADKHEKKRKRGSQHQRGGGTFGGRSRGRFGRGRGYHGGGRPFATTYPSYNSYQGRSGNFGGRSFGGYRGRGRFQNYNRGGYRGGYQGGGAAHSGGASNFYGGAMTNNNYGRGRGRSNWRGNPRGFQPGRVSGGREAYAYEQTAGRVASHPGRVTYGGGSHQYDYQQQQPYEHYQEEQEMHYMDVGPTQHYDEKVEMEMFAYDDGAEYYDDGSGTGSYGQGW